MVSPHRLISLAPSTQLESQGIFTLVSDNIAFGLVGVQDFLIFSRKDPVIARSLAAWDNSGNSDKQAAAMVRIRIFLERTLLLVVT